MAEFEKSKMIQGRLKIFLGYAAGVGKTYEMLEEAQQLKKRGIDVVVGYVEPHDRPETTSLLQGLEQLPQKAHYSDIFVNEFNLDAALKRHPNVLIVDELAHTNTNQKYHKKRYQDIEVLLEAGVNVYTTMNIQHLESLHDVISRLTHVEVQESVPDSFFDRADQIELVDIDPEELLERMRLGKIYSPSEAQRALDNFFTERNLTALRETALRRMTMRMSVQQETTEKLLVCFSGSPTSKSVLRSAAQLAHALSGEIIALYISRDESDIPVVVKENSRLAEELGIRVVTLYGEQRGDLITEYCKAQHITKLILGSGRTSWLAKIRYHGSLIDQLNQELPSVDKYIIPHKKVHRHTSVKRNTSTGVGLKNIAVIMAFLTLATLVGNLYVLAHIASINIVLIYILTVMFVSLLTHTRWSGALTAVLSVVLYNFFFTIPYGSLLSNSQNWVTFIMMGIIGLLSSSWTTRLQAQSAYEANRANRTEILLDASHAFEKTNTIDDVLMVLGRQAHKLFKAKVSIYSKEKEDLGIPMVFEGPSSANSSLTADNERAVATWVLKHNHAAGKMTDTLPNESNWYLPIQENNQSTVAVMCISLAKQTQLDDLNRNLMTSILDTGSLAIQRIREAEARRRANAMIHQEKLRYELLRGISHDLRTPLTTISGNADILKTQGEKLSTTQISLLSKAIYNDSVWLTQMVENLLSMTRITNGRFQIKAHPELMVEIVNEALQHLSPGVETHEVTFKISDDMMMVSVDAQLIIQVIVNIINNAIQYTPRNSRISIHVVSQNNMALASITNNGPHISEESQEHLFDLFYSKRNGNSSRRGMGIGLALCRTIIQASGGEIGVKNEVPEGVSFYFTLPLWEDEK